MHIPQRDLEAFYSGSRTERVHFCINDSVEVLSGEFAGKMGSVVALIQVEPSILFRLECGDTGSEASVEQASLRLIER